MKHKFVSIDPKNMAGVSSTEKLLNEDGWKVTRHIVTENYVLLQLAKLDDEDVVEPEFVPVIETAIEINIPKLKEGEEYDEAKDPILKLTKQGWVVKLFSGKAQLTRHSAPPEEEEKSEEPS